ncbi:hypothetical protein AB1339_22395 [Streptomyces cyaneofuscatus]|uniref:hypothetical protein n=1 Tax=Streptomyces cyaneofuscatus TaxID=66883 RepID=UPI00345DC39F
MADDVHQLIALAARLPERVVGGEGQAPVRLREKLALYRVFAGVQEREDIGGDLGQGRRDVGRCLAARVNRPRVVREERPPQHSVDRRRVRHTRSVVPQHGHLEAFAAARFIGSVEPLLPGQAW